MMAQVPVMVLRSDLLPLAVGLLVSAAGGMACALFALRLKQRDWPLLYFGLVAVMFGVRLEATTATAGYLVSGDVLGWVNAVMTGFILLPFTLFFVEVLFPGHRRSEIWLAIVTGVEGTLYTLAQLSARTAVIANRANSVVVLIALPAVLVMLFFPRRPVTRDLWVIRVGVLTHLGFAAYTNAVSLGMIPGNPTLEYLGFAILLGCLGYVAVRRAVEGEERLDSIQRELALAQRIQSRLLPGDVVVKGVEVATRYVPVAWVAGDFYDFLQRDDGVGVGAGIGVLIADVAGHGVPAALAASMVKIAIRAQAERADDPGAVLRGMNETLLGNVDAQFVTAAYLYMDVGGRELRYSAAGHPAMLVWRAAEGKVEAIEENGLFLGAFAGCEYSTRRMGLAEGDRCLLYTDGILEAPNAAGEEFGPERLGSFMAEHAGLRPGAFCDALLARIEAWCGRREGKEQHDDLTLVMMEFGGK